jgi:hypothetical protein
MPLSIFLIFSDYKSFFYHSGCPAEHAEQRGITYIHKF